jgi:peptidoglycan hydrolase-like protein with peptidoglycan-binding domain
MRLLLLGSIVAVTLCVPLSTPAATLGDAEVAALQSGLRALGLYPGDIDGLAGDQTLAGLRRLPGATTPLAPATRLALGEFGAHPLGSRPLAGRISGWDVAALQFLLAWHGFPSGPMDGSFGPRTERALVQFQQWAGLPPVGVAGPQTLAALRAPPPVCPVSLTWPLSGPVTDGFGPRGARFHAGIDIAASTSTPVAAASGGTVVAAGWRAGGFGQTVELEHEQGVTTLYLHLAKVLVKPGQQVARGATLGLVGATGDATGPHLHFEIRVRGAAVDPMTALT